MARRPTEILLPLGEKTIPEGPDEGPRRRSEVPGIRPSGKAGAPPAKGVDLRAAESALRSWWNGRFGARLGQGRPKGPPLRGRRSRALSKPGPEAKIASKTSRRSLSRQDGDEGRGVGTWPGHGHPNRRPLPPEGEEGSTHLTSKRSEGMPAPTPAVVKAGAPRRRNAAAKGGA